MAADTLHFYRDLPALSSFADVAQQHAHADLPGDWWIAIADVVGSTKAIEAGAYKKVNTVGVACIAAVVNVDRAIDLPFIFGGDGATFAIPDSLRERVILALRGAQQLAQDSFGLNLRVGLVQVASLTAQDFYVRMGKIKLSPHVMQPVLSGRGWEEAERRVKSEQAQDVLRVTVDDGPADASFEGFECRWQGVPSFHDHKLSLLVAAMSADAQTNLATYRRVLAQIEVLYGDVTQYHPLRAGRMHMAFHPKLLAHEWRVRTSQFNAWRRVKYFVGMLFANTAGSYLFANNKDTQAVRWSRYRDELVENSDFRKFDGMLRMVIDGSEAQAAQLQEFLEAEYRQGQLAYGIHKSSEALVTCIVQSYNGKHQHFVDGSDGGYAIAARELKKRLAEMMCSKRDLI
ncbi:MAG: DUF3095 domain-containing protein [Proteobacteria bacterium]|nr:DUF3095 domain-containing protein [Pseudomonadota bacterium]